MVSHWNLLKFPGLFSVFWPILIVVWVVSTRPLISMSFSLRIKPLMIVPRAPITIGITVTFMFHRFFNSLWRSRNFSFFSFSFNFTLLSSEIAKSRIRQVLFYFLLAIIRSGRLPEIKWSVCILNSLGSSCVSFTRTDSVLSLTICSYGQI